MKVKTSGFALDFQGVNIFDFLRYLRKEVGYIRDNRILVVDEIENTNGLFWGGYFLNLREEKLTTQVKITEKELEIVLHEITEEDVYHGAFNFFLINTNTRKGLFQTYAGAARWSNFSFYLNHRFNNFQKDTNNREAWFVPSALFTQVSFEEYLNKFEWIKEIAIETSHYEVDERDFQSLNGEATRRVEIFKFYKRDKWNLKRIKKSLLSIYKEEKAEDLRFEGTIDGVPRAYTLANNTEIFYEQEYEDWVKNLIFTDKDRNKSVNSSQSIRDLIRIYYDTLYITRLDQRDKVIGI